MIVEGCYIDRLEQAQRHLSRGEWASGHAITRRVLACSGTCGCPYSYDCSCAANDMMDRIRAAVGEQRAMH